MPASPFSTLPLKDSPYLSRINSNYTKNYYLTAFNPGYALQAAELNEMQELFFINQSLSLRYPNIWLSRNYTKTGFWEGAVPYDPNLVKKSSNTSISSGALTFTAIITSGWFLWTDTTSKLNFWIFNPNNYTQSFTTRQNNNTDFVGFLIKKDTKLCCQTNPCPQEQDATLRDGTSSSEFTCGASRLGLTITSLAIRNSLTAQESDGSVFYPILSARAANGSSAEIKFIDGQDVSTQ